MFIAQLETNLLASLAFRSLLYWLCCKVIAPFESILLALVSQEPKNDIDLVSQEPKNDIDLVSQEPKNDIDLISQEHKNDIDCISQEF